MKKHSIVAVLALITLSHPARAELTFKWMGVTGGALSDGPTTLILDPAMSSTPLWQFLPFQKVKSDQAEVDYWISRCGLTRADAVLVNHSHTDHVIDAPAVLRRLGGTLYGSSSAANVALGAGIDRSQIHALKDGEVFQVGAFKITARVTPHAPHIGSLLIADGEITRPLTQPAAPWDYRVGDTFSYWIEHPEGKILLHSLGRVLKQDVLKDYRPDSILMTIVNRVDLDDLIINRVIPSGAPQVVALHWDNFFLPMERNAPPKRLWFQKLDEFKARFESLAPKSQLIWPEYCKPLRIGSGALKPASP